jgi:hypothetical protein
MGMVKPALTKAGMERIVSGGCQIEGCKHDHHDPVIYLHTRCHPSVPFVLSFVGPIASLTCDRCGGLMCDFAIAYAEPDPVAPLCCNKFKNKRLYWGSYTRGSGLVELTCYFCKAPVLTLRLLEDGRILLRTDDASAPPG